MIVEFSCSRCEQTAGRVQLLLPGEPAKGVSQSTLEALDALGPVLRRRTEDLSTLIVESFCGTDIQPVAAERLDTVRRALDGQDSSALYQLAYSYAPFHCPECAHCFCGEHWRWHSFTDERNDIEGIEGSCPDGHFHVLKY